jgi:hypothetical protein
MWHTLRVAGPLVAIGAVLGLVVSACSGHDSSPSGQGPTGVLQSPTPTPTETIPPKPPKPPAMSACYRLGYDEALAPTIAKKPVSCLRLHTAVTFFVGSYAKHLAVDGAPVHRLEASACSRRFATFVGGTLEDRRLSMLRTVWFTPTVDQAARGGHWFQCVAIALRGDQSLALLRGRVRGVLASTTGRDHYGLCGTSEPGAPGFEQRICATPHTWRALSTVGFPPGPYPGVEKVRTAGQGPCRDAGRNVSSDPLNYQWSYQWPSRKLWRGGQIYGICWAPSS